MATDDELLELAAAAIDEISRVLERLRASYPDSSVVEQCTEVKEQLVWYLKDAREKLSEKKLTNEDAAALALIVNRGMEKMISIVEADEDGTPEST